MAKEAELPDGTILEFPDETSDAVMDMVVKKHLARANSGLVEGPQEMPQIQPEQSGWDDIKGGIASAPINAYLGIKQMLPGGLDDIEKSVLQQNKEAASKAPVSSFLSNVAMAAPTALIPGANTLTGAGVIGAGYGLMNPADSAQEKLINAALGAAGGVGGQKLGNAIGSKLSSSLADNEAKIAAFNAINDPIRSVLKKGRAEGMVINPSAVNPSATNKILESIAGKAPLKQQATIDNQLVTNALARKALGMSDDTPISHEALNAINESITNPVYKKLADLPTPNSLASGYGVNSSNIDDSARLLSQLKDARIDKQALQAKYPKDSADFAKLNQFKAVERSLNDEFKRRAETAGTPELIDEFVGARKNMAKVETVRKALNDAAGEVSAPALGAVEKRKPDLLTDELKLIAQFNNNFPQVMGSGVKTPTPGVSQLLPYASAAGLGVQGGGLVGGLPLLSGPIRSLLLSDFYQKHMADLPKKEVSALLKTLTKTANSESLKRMTPAMSSGILNYINQSGSQ